MLNGYSVAFREIVKSVVRGKYMNLQKNEFKNIQVCYDFENRLDWCTTDAKSIV